MKRKIRYLSLFSGIEAATVAWSPLGFDPVAFAEIEPFPSAVLAHRYSGVPNLGDVIELRDRLCAGEDVLELLSNPPDIVVGGSPCQAFSVAGARQGISSHRGNLTLVYAEIVNAINPSLIVWENVPGVLSMRDNAFGHLLGALAGEDSPLEPPGKRWSNAGAVSGPERNIAWRVLDAQYFGVAQQRRRVFLVASRRDGCFPDPWEILFESEGLRRDTPPRRDSGETVAGTLASRTGAGGFPGTDEACAGYVQAVTGVFGDISHTLRAEGFDASEDGTGRGTPVIAAFAENTRRELRLEGGDGSRTGALSTGGGKPGQGCPAIIQSVPEIAGTMKSCARSGGWTNSVDHAAAGYMIPAFGFNSLQDPIVTGNKTGALSASSPQAEAVFSVAIRGRDGGSGIEIRSDSVASALRASQGGSDKPMVFALQPGVTRENPDSGPDGMGVRENLAYTMEARSEVQMVGGFPYGVRRLMPVECARLQGFPDDYLDIPYRGKPAADGPKYKALGNSMAVPVMRWIGERIFRRDIHDEEVAEIMRC